MKYKHYIQVDEVGRIIAGWSNGPRRDKDCSGAVLLTDQGGYHFRLMPGKEENPCLINHDGTHRYIYDPALSPAVRPATADEIAAERETILAYQRSVSEYDLPLMEGFSVEHGYKNAYYKNSNNLVLVSIAVRRQSLSVSRVAQIATLPAGFRPRENIISNEFCIKPDGSIWTTSEQDFVSGLIMFYP